MAKNGPIHVIVHESKQFKVLKKYRFKQKIIQYPESVLFPLVRAHNIWGHGIRSGSVYF